MPSAAVRILVFSRANGLPQPLTCYALVPPSRLLNDSGFRPQPKRPPRGKAILNSNSGPFPIGLPSSLCTISLINNYVWICVCLLHVDIPTISCPPWEKGHACSSHSWHQTRRGGPQKILVEHVMVKINSNVSAEDISHWFSARTLSLLSRKE